VEKNPQTSPDGRPHHILRSIRAETIAAVASAIAAVASAIVAAYALVFLSHQEEIAKKQVRATYLTNLYNKQVDSFAALETALSKVEASSAGLHIRRLYLRKQLDDSFQNLYKEALSAGYEQFNSDLDVLAAKTDELSLVTPETFTQIAQQPIKRYLAIRDEVSGFLLASQSLDAFHALQASIEIHQANLALWKKYVIPCARRILAKGNPIISQELDHCEMPAKENMLQ
jgi:hypothetical protein